MADFKVFRKINNITQAEIALYLGCTQGFISQIEKGLRPIPDEFIKKILSNPKWDSSLFTSEEQMLEMSLPTESTSTPQSSNSNISISPEAWEVIRNQAASLKERDDMISRMISISERSLVQVERAMAHYDKLFSALSGDFVAYNPYAGRREGKNPPPIKSGKK